ncbi:MAG: tetratricopeptide repeat protein [Tepidisphaeraceae bacterium]|jgi:tetratricopeptide (TPR) repeat protein
MNSCGNRIFGGILAIGIAGAAFVFMTGCGMDTQNVLTWSQDAKREGLQQYNDGRYAEAAGAFRNAIRQNPQDPESEYWLGLCYEQTQSWHEAIDAYKTSLQLMPPPGTVHYSVGMHDSAFDRLAHLIASNDSTGTEIDLMAQTAAQSHLSEDFRLLGRVFRFRGDADNGLENYRRAVQIEPENFAAQRELGLYLEQLTQNQEAGQVLRDAYRLNQSDEQVNNALRRIGMEPGPGLLARQQPPAHPTMPPLPSVDPGLPTPAANSAGPSPDVAPPRD